MVNEKTEISEGLMKIHELVDTINVNISYLKANMLDGKEAKNVIQRFNELDKLITDLQTEFSSVKKRYLKPEYPAQRRKRWKTAPTC